MTAHRTAAEVARRYPGVSVWRGDFTRSWWALARDRAGTCHLVEVPSPPALARRLDDLAVPRSTPPAPVPRYSRARLTAVPELPRTEAPARPLARRRHRATPRPRLRNALDGLVAS